MQIENLIKTALGEIVPDLVLCNARIVNVFTGEITLGDIALKDGFIAAVGSYKHGIDLDGRYVIPGLIDAHLHVESSMVTPPAYCMEVLRHGTTTLITDPHEIANVKGSDGINFMLDASADIPINYFVQLPSCVPTTKYEHSGAVFTAEKMAEFLKESRVLGLGELMDYPSVANCAPEIMAKLDLFSERVIDGHSPNLTGNDLQAYVSAGVHTDHESTSYEEAREKLQAGLSVLVRQGSQCKNIGAILSGVLKNNLDTFHMAFCTDDKHLSDIHKQGTICENVRLAIALGMKPVTAIQMATINAAKIYRLPHLGAVAAGYQADLVVLDNLEKMQIHSVYHKGKCVHSSNGKPQQPPPFDMQNHQALLHTVNFAPLKETTFTLPEKETYPVINIIKDNVTTTRSQVAKAEVQKLISLGVLRKIAVVERHHATGNVGVGLVAGYGLTHGAIATTVAHDSHNLIILGDNDKDMLAAANELLRVQGGYTIVADGEVVKTLPLPICGLMSNAPANEVIAALDELTAKAHEAGIAEGIDPFQTLSFMSLPVIPEIRITDMGIFNVTTFSFE